MTARVVVRSRDKQKHRFALNWTLVMILTFNKLTPAIRYTTWLDMNGRVTCCPIYTGNFKMLFMPNSSRDSCWLARFEKVKTWDSRGSRKRKQRTDNIENKPCMKINTKKQWKLEIKLKCCTMIKSESLLNSAHSNIFNWHKIVAEFLTPQEN